MLYILSTIVAFLLSYDIALSDIKKEPLETVSMEYSTYETVEDMISRTMGDLSPIALKIAMCESKQKQFEPDGVTVLRGTYNPKDVGIFQINEKYHLKKSRELGLSIYTAQGNIDYANWLMRNEGIHHWNWSRPCWSK